MTTGKENQEPDVIETLPEEPIAEEENNETTIAPRIDVKRRSNRRIYRHHSTKRGTLITLTFTFCIYIFLFFRRKYSYTFMDIGPQKGLGSDSLGIPGG